MLSTVPLPAIVVLPVPAMVPPAQVKAPEIVVAALPPSTPPSKRKALPRVSACSAFSVALPLSLSRPVPSMTETAPVCSVPLSSTRSPEPVSSKLPAMRLPPVLSLRRKRSAPLAAMTLAPSSALTVATPPLPEAR